MAERGTKNQVLNGLFWKVMENGGSQGIQFVISILLARLLSPDEYGVINLVLIFVTIANVIVQNGCRSSRRTSGITPPYFTLTWGRRQ